MKALLKMAIMASILSGYSELWLPCSSQARAQPAAQRPSRSAAASVPKQFKKASDAYDKKRYEDAVDLLTDILQKQADNLPARVLLLHSLYQQNKLGEVYKIGKSIDPDLLETDASYELAQAAFKENDFALALTCFKRVPEGHSLYDLAGYYGGICAFKLGEYEQSIKMLRQAVVLPSKFSKSQKLFQKEAEKMLLLKQKRELEAAAGTPTTAQKTPQPQAPAPSTPNLPPPVDDEPASDRSYRLLRPLRRVELVPRYTYQEHESGSQAVSEHQIKQATLAFSLGGSYAAADAAPHFLLQGQAAIHALEGCSGQLPFFSDVREEQFLELCRRRGPRSILYGEVTGAVERPLGQASTLGLTVGSFAHSVELLQDATILSPYITVFLAHKKNAIDAKLGLAFYTHSLAGESLSSNIRESAAMEVQLPARFRVGVLAEGSQYSYAKKLSEGTDWYARTLLELGYEIDGAFELAGGAFYEQSWQLKNVPASKSQLVYQQAMQGFQARGELQLASFLKLGALLRTADMSYSELGPDPLVNEAVFRPAFIRSNTHFSIYTSAGTNF